MSRFGGQLAKASAAEGAKEFDIPILIDPDDKPFGVRFRVLAGAAAVKAVEKDAEAFAKSYDQARFDASIPEHIRELIPTDKKARKEILTFIGKLQATQIGVVELEFNDQEEITKRTLTDEKVTDEEWIWVQGMQGYNWKYIEQQWALSQTLRRETALLEEADAAGKSSKPATSNAGATLPPSNSGDENPTS